jgi:uncharacterized protein (TIGR03067 family)
MKHTTQLTVALVLSTLAFTPTLSSSAQEVEPGFKSLFNGKDLTGWAGRMNHWSVQDGAITGTTTKEDPAKGNNFLIARDGDKNLEVADFELRLAYKFTGDSGNSGIQYRSKDVGNFVVHGYQADMETGPTYTGILYEEGGRGILCERGKKVVIKDDSANPGKPKIEVVGSLGDPKEIGAAIKQGNWNDYVIVAQGNHLQQFINGKQTVDVTDEQASKAAKSGILALQLHQGPPMKIQFKNIRIKTGSGAEAVASDLQRVQGDWVAVEFVANGQEASADDASGVKLKIKGNEFFAEFPQGQAQGTLKLNGTASPKSMDATTEAGDQVPGIYEISGATFRICYAMNDAPRPKEFKSADGSDCILITFKRKP